jgi:hypothetical protein
MEDPGIDRHEWESEWEALEPLVIDSPAEALPELDGLLERMLVARGFPIDAEEVDESGEREIVAEFLEARRIAEAVDRGETVDPGDIGAAITAYRSLYDELVNR